jgi:hypothetical protein
MPANKPVGAAADLDRRQLMPTGCKPALKLNAISKRSRRRAKPEGILNSRLALEARPLTLASDKRIDSEALESSAGICIKNHFP